MKKFVADFVVIGSTLTFIASIALYLNHQRENTQASPVNATVVEERKIYVDEKGYPKYTLGVCNNDSDCVPAGCSGQICSSSEDLVTTCEIRQDFPDKNIYSCGCVSDFCTWYEE